LNELKFNFIKITNRARLATRIFYLMYIRQRIGRRAYVKGEDEEEEMIRLSPENFIASIYKLNHEKSREVQSLNFDNSSIDNSTA